MFVPTLIDSTAQSRLYRDFQSQIPFQVHSNQSKRSANMNDNNRSLLFKTRVFPDIEQQVRIWNTLFSGIGDIDKRTLNQATPDQSIRVCFPRVSFLAEGSACIYGILHIKEALSSLCREAKIELCDDSDFFHPDTLKKEEERIRALENQFDSQTSKLIVASVQFWMLRPREGVSKFPNGQLPMSISHASALLCVVQGGPGNLWGGGFENYWFCCLGSPSVPGGAPCFDFFRGNLCITPHEHLGKPEEIGGAASVFVN